MWLTGTCFSFLARGWSEEGFGFFRMLEFGGRMDVANLLFLDVFERFLVVLMFRDVMSFEKS